MREDKERKGDITYDKKRERNKNIIYRDRDIKITREIELRYYPCTVKNKKIFVLVTLYN